MERASFDAANRWAWASVLTGFSAVLLWWAFVPGPLAVVFAIVALVKMRRHRHTSTGVAVFGLLLGLLEVGIFALAFGFATHQFLSGPHGIG